MEHVKKPFLGNQHFKINNFFQFGLRTFAKTFSKHSNFTNQECCPLWSPNSRKDFFSYFLLLSQRFGPVLIYLLLNTPLHTWKLEIFTVSLHVNVLVKLNLALWKREYVIMGHRPFTLFEATVLLEAANWVTTSLDKILQTPVKGMRKVPSKLKRFITNSYN